jgi:hypothetical protein
MTTSTSRLDDIRQGVLDRVERHDRMLKLSIGGAVLVEALMLAVALMQIDFSVRFERAIFILFVLSYTVLLLGMVALGAHVSKVGDRLLAVLDPATDR